MHRATILAVLLSLLAIAGTSRASQAARDGLKEAIFAGGCFWCVEADFDKVPGVKETISGYTGGAEETATYEQVSGGGTGHLESVKIVYDPKQVTYAQLLNVFWHSVDPTDDGGQFCDRGSSYRTAIFAVDEEQLRSARRSKTALEQAGELKRSIVTQVRKAGPFYPAEDHHQDYYRKNPTRYAIYRFGCGRDARLQQLWGDKAHAGIPKK